MVVNNKNHIDLAAETNSLVPYLNIFSKAKHFFCGYVDPVHIYLMMTNINTFRGDISAEMATLVPVPGQPKVTDLAHQIFASH